MLFQVVQCIIEKSKFIEIFSVFCGIVFGLRLSVRNYPGRQTVDVDADIPKTYDPHAKRLCVVLGEEGAGF